VTPRVLLVKDGLGVGGAERQLVLLARGLAAHGESVEVVNLAADCALAPTLGAIPTYQLPRRSRFDAKPIVRLARLVRHSRPHVVHSFHWLANVYTSLALLLVPRTARPRHVVGLRGYYYLGRKGALRAAIDRHLARRVDMAVANCQALVRHAQAYRIVYKNARVIYNGVPLPTVAPAGRADLRFASLGRLEAVKRPKDVVLAAAEVCAAYAEARFDFIGDGSERAALQSLIDALGMQAHVHIHGRVEDPTPLLRQSTGLVLSSEHEGLPNAVLEGMAVGLPIVATRVGGVPEAVEHGVNGLLVRPGRPAEIASAVKALIADSELRQRMGQCSRERAQQRFRVDAMVSAYEEVYAWM
jgi:glycosyltransferase involved in cell wall biosynthesis